MRIEFVLFIMKIFIGTPKLLYVINLIDEWVYECVPKVA